MKKPSFVVFDEPRATGWVRTELYGDRDKAGELIPVARVQLGRMRIMYGVNQRIGDGEPGGFYHATNTLPDGSVIQTTTNNGQDIIRIQAAPDAPEEEDEGEPSQIDYIAVAGHYVYNSTYYYYAPYRWKNGAGFDYPEFLPAYYYGVAEGMSEDGEMLCGYMGGDDYEQAFTWTPNGGTVGLGWLADEENSHATAVAADGGTVAGYSGDKAFVWAESEGLKALADLPNERSTVSVATAVSGDGALVAGFSLKGNGYGEGAFYGVIWSGTTRAVVTELPLDGSLETYTGAYITRLREDFDFGGGVTSWTDSVYVPSTWNTPGTITTTRSDGTTSVQPNIASVPPYPYTVTGSTTETITGLEAGVHVTRTFYNDLITWDVPYGMRVYGMSQDGTVVVGACGKGPEAFIWSAEFGLEMLGFLPGDTISQALAISADGSTVTGYSFDESNRWFTWSRPATDPITGITTGGMTDLTQGSGNAATQAGAFTAGRSGNYSDDDNSLSVVRSQPDGEGVITQYDIGQDLNADKGLPETTPNEARAITSFRYVTNPDDSVEMLEDPADAQID